PHAQSRNDAVVLLLGGADLDIEATLLEIGLDAVEMVEARQYDLGVELGSFAVEGETAHLCPAVSRHHLRQLADQSEHARRRRAAATEMEVGRHLRFHVLDAAIVGEELLVERLGACLEHVRAMICPYTTSACCDERDHDPSGCKAGGNTPTRPHCAA